jgi:hypothetical protein
MFPNVNNQLRYQRKRQQNTSGNIGNMGAPLMPMQSHQNSYSNMNSLDAYQMPSTIGMLPLGMNSQIHSNVGNGSSNSNIQT